jgi:very-short-patch-repair endonuclease
MMSSPIHRATATGRITHVTRRRLVEGFAAMPTAHWSGDLDEPDFLARLYPLEDMPSNDPRYDTAGRDIFQHRVLNPCDWPDDWIFRDERFGLADNDEALLAFLVEMLHPEVRTNLAEVEQLRDFLNKVLIHDGYEIVQVDAISGAPIFDYRLIGSGVRGSMKNLIFAALGPKPEIVLDDAVNNDLHFVRNAENCLVYDRPLGAHGLTWAELTDWWADRQGMTGEPDRDISRSLYRRLDQSLGDNDAERRILHTYAERYVRLGPGIPALIPQVYLHYDPYTATERRAPGPLPRQRMDFLLLLPHRARVVIECDGKQHYADDDGRANPRQYADMMRADRDLRLKGYEVYRFGGAELVDDDAAQHLLSAFFDRLHQRYHS